MDPQRRSKGMLLLATIAVLGAGGCSTPRQGTLSPDLTFEIGSEIGLTGARDLTVDRSGNVYVFSYDDYSIFKFDPTGKPLARFGGTGEEPGLFRHLMAIRADGDSVFALGAGALSVFDSSGNLRSHRALADTVVCDLPRLHVDGSWVGEWIIQETAEQALTYRNPDGTERSRLASYALGTHFPGLRAGEMFFINRMQAPGYLYGFQSDGRLVWMPTDHLTVYERQGDEDRVLYEVDATPVPYPEEEIRELEQRQETIPPPFFLNVPRHYQLAHHLSVADTGDIWVYVMSVERTGLLRLSPNGREIGFYTMEADLDMLSTRLTVAENQMYFLVSSPEKTAIYNVAVP